MERLISSMIVRNFVVCTSSVFAFFFSALAQRRVPKNPFLMVNLRSYPAGTRLCLGARRRLGGAASGSSGACITIFWRSDFVCFFLSDNNLIIFCFFPGECFMGLYWEEREWAHLTLIWKLY